MTTFRNNQGSKCYFMWLSLDKHLPSLKKDLYFFEKAIDENKIEIDELNAEMQKSEDLAGKSVLIFGLAPKKLIHKYYTITLLLVLNSQHCATRNGLRAL